MTARTKLIRGGSSAGKTLAILPILINKCCHHPNLEVSVISESVPHLKKGAMKDFKKIMKWTGRWNEDHWHDTDRKYTFHNGAYIEFFSPESVLGSRRNILYVNEANRIKYQDYVQLAMRTSDERYLDWNPEAAFWADTEIMTEPNVQMEVLTYLDNEARPKNVDEDFAAFRAKAALEKAQGLPITSYWQNYCRVYIEGELGNIQGLVFNNWDQVDEIPQEAEFISFGLDYGFTNDPTAIIEVWRHEGNIYVDELLYETGLTNSDIITKLPLIGVTKHRSIVPDSAEPKSNEDLRRAGYNVDPAKKGPDSVRNSIDTLQQNKIYITKRSLNLIKEFRSYRWKVDQAGKSLNEPVDANNHGIDAIRYVASNKLKGDNEWSFHR